MSQALDQISRLPFMRKIEGARLPRRFNQPTFTIYNGRTNPVEHVSYFNQRMAVHSKDEALICKVFPSNLGPMAMRWFDGLKEGSIDSFKKLTQAFSSRFVTCSKVPQPLDSLLSLSMRERGNPENVLGQILRNVGLPTEHGLRKSLTGKPVTSVRQLIDRIDKYKRVEEDQQ
ncbi:uncharacterized protein LOC136068236 [Quercus suber]|uniref:uncharacterized protein LOC136068236 n=1 Tax=Quercus suber TaxID=58331 RepID=UPI0032DEE840